MTEEERKKLQEEGKSEVEIMQLEKIAEMEEKMSKMVDPVEFEKLKNAHKKLLDDYINRRQPPKQEEPQTRPAKDIATELAKIKSGDISNRAYIEKALEYRKAHIKEFGTDPFTDFGQHGPQKATDETNQVATVLEKLLEENPNPVDFRIKLNSVLKDDPQLMAKLRKGAK